MTKKELLQRLQDISVPRNPVLAKLFRCAKLCENAGFGFDKMLMWKQATTHEVIFEYRVDASKVTFMLDPVPDLVHTGQIGGQIGGQIELTRQQQVILKMIEENNAVSRKTLAEALKINTSAVQKHLEALVKKGYIRREGKTRASYWVVIKLKD